MGQTVDHSRMTAHLRRGPFSLRVPMLPSDALFWHAEEATAKLRMQIAGLLMLDRAPDADRLRASMQGLIARVPRLRERVAETPLRLGLPSWEAAPHFDLDYHLRRVVLPQPGTRRRLLEFCGNTLVSPLDHLRPLWEAYAVEGLEGGRAAFLFKLHHAIVDGVGSMALFEAVTQPHRNGTVPVPRSHHRYLRSAAREPAVPAASWWTTAAGVGAALESVGWAMSHPVTSVRQALHSAGQVGGMIREFNARAVRDPLANAAGGIGRRLDVLEFSQPQLHRTRNALGVTLNDLVLAVIAGAVGRYHERCGLPVDELQCVVPMNLRQADERGMVGNRVGVIIVSLPVGEPDPLLRLEKIVRQTTVAKGNGHGSASHLLMQTLAFIPGVAFRAFSETVSGKIGLICTNVPGPRVTRFLGGAKVEAIHPFLPAMFGIPLTVALLSYGDVLSVGINTDPAAIKKPALLARYVADAAREMECRATGTKGTGPITCRNAKGPVPIDTITAPLLPQ